MTTKKKKKNSLGISDEEIEALKKIKEFKLACEANIVSILWSKPELFHTYDNLTLNSFLHNEWKVYFTIGHDIIIKENKNNLDDITVGLYLEKHLKLKEKYLEYGGYNTIVNASEYIKEENLDGYINELNKWNVLIQLVKNRFPIAYRLNEFIDMGTEEIYGEFETLLNHMFGNVEGDDVTYTIANGIDELIDRLDEGTAVGLPLYNSPTLTAETGGNLEGNITLMGGLSGVGKTTLSRNLIIPSIVENNEKIVIMINEEGKDKWQRELLIWVANNIYSEEVPKYKLRDGGYSKEFKSFLKGKCAKWIKDHDKQIILKPFKSYSTSKAIKCIKKYTHMGVKYFMLDTFKADADTLNSEAFWFNLQQNMVKIYDTIKPENKNIHIWITFQLAKSSTKQRCYTQDNIGLAKNIIDVASTCLMVRKLFEDEMPNGKHELTVYKFGGKTGKTKIPVDLDQDKHYQLIFIVKNREGGCNEYAIVVEHDLSRNIYNEIGLTVVPVDF